MKRLFFLLLCVLPLTGCSTLSSLYSDTFSDNEETDPPAPLASLEQAIPLKQLWSTRIGVGTDGHFVKLEPAVYGRQLLAADRRGRVTALDAETGKTLWQVDTGTRITAGPGAGEGLALIATSDAEVLALDIETGELAWRTEVSSEVLAVPRIDLGIVVIQSADGKVAGLDAADGHKLWIYDRTVPVLTLRGTSTPAVEHGLVVAGFANGKVVAISADKGFVVWETSVAIPQGRSELERMVDVDADPVIAGNTVFVTTYQGRIAVIDLGNGDLGWTRDMSSHAGLGVDFAQVYVTDDQSHVWALSRENGASVWKQDKLHGRSLTAPVPFGDYVAVGDYEGYLHLLSRYDGHIAARAQVDSKGIQARPLVLGDVLYVYGSSGTLAAYTITGG